MLTKQVSYHSFKDYFYSWIFMLHFDFYEVTDFEIYRYLDFKRAYYHSYILD